MATKAIDMMHRDIMYGDIQLHDHLCPHHDPAARWALADRLATEAIERLDVEGVPAEVLVLYTLKQGVSPPRMETRLGDRPCRLSKACGDIEEYFYERGGFEVATADGAARLADVMQGLVHEPLCLWRTVRPRDIGVSLWTDTNYGVLVVAVHYADSVGAEWMTPRMQKEAASRVQREAAVLAKHIRNFGYISEGQGVSRGIRQNANKLYNPAPPVFTYARDAYRCLRKKHKA